jgi:ABC-type enterochelin transport system substrate-binding protein
MVCCYCCTAYLHARLSILALLTSALAKSCAAQVRRQLEAAHKASAESRAEAARLAGELAARDAEVEQLSSLSLRGDATLQDYMASLKVSAASAADSSCVAKRAIQSIA